MLEPQTYAVLMLIGFFVLLMIGIPVAVSTFGAPVSKFSRGSGARVTIKRVPDVSILKRIVLLVLS